MSDHGLTIDTQGLLHRILQKYAGRHVHFFPKLGNCGDGFISYATYEIFKAYNINFTAHRQADTVQNGVVFIGGGGNLIEGLYTHVADIIRAHCSDNEIVLLPHTIVGYADVLKETFRNLVVFCRDRVSYDMALANGANPNNVGLAHDMTFYLNDNHFDMFKVRGTGLLNALRQDSESTWAFAAPDGNVDISRCWDGDIWTSPTFSEYATKSLFAFVAPYEAVVTDRLHVSIIASFLQKNVVLLPNSYFKNSAVYAHSMRNRFSLTRFGATPENLHLVASYGAALARVEEESLGTPLGNSGRRGAGSAIQAVLSRLFRS